MLFWDSHHEFENYRRLQSRLQHLNNTTIWIDRVCQIREIRSEQYWVPGSRSYFARWRFVWTSDCTVARKGRYLGGCKISSSWTWAQSRRSWYWRWCPNLSKRVQIKWTPLSSSPTWEAECEDTLSAGYLRRLGIEWEVFIIFLVSLW